MGGVCISLIIFGGMKMSLTEYYLDREYENISNEIETIMFINLLRSQWRTITRNQFMNKYNLFEYTGVREIKDSLREADIKKLILI